MRTTITIQGMHCASCVKPLTEAFQKVPGVTAAHVTLEPPQAQLESDTPISEDALERAARSAGDYSVTAGPTDGSGSQFKPSAPEETGPQKPPSLYPLGLIVAYIAGTAAALVWGH